MGKFNRLSMLAITNMTDDQLRAAMAFVVSLGLYANELSPPAGSDPAARKRSFWADVDPACKTVHMALQCILSARKETPRPTTNRYED